MKAVDPCGGYTPPPWAGNLALIPAKRLRMAQVPTPLYPVDLSGLGFSPEVALWVKRDDLTGCALSGNKLRKLEFLLAEALQQNADVVITCGGIQSNHARATALAARECGLAAHLLLAAPRPQDDPGVSGNLLLDRLVDACLHLISPEDYLRRDELMAAMADKLRKQGRRPYIIPEGGSNALGAWGYLEAVREWELQAAGLGVCFDDVVCACGSAGTAAGLGLGVQLAGLRTRVHAVNVQRDAAYFHACMDRLFQELGAAVRSRDVVDIMEGHVGAGYACSRPEELEFIRDVARQTGLLLDPVYTGKALFGLRAELQRQAGRFKGRRILFFHTGGLFGLYDKAGELAPFLTAAPPPKGC